MVKYIHIGYPKNFSTSLQRDYFSKHPEIDHLGIGVNDNLGYKNSLVEKSLEVYLKSCKYFKYKEVESNIINHFQSAFLAAKNNNYKAVGISAEHLGFSFTYDSLSVKEKAERLSTIFGDDTKIIMIVRNQFDLIKSLYRECVRVGFKGEFSYFIKLIYKYQDRNFVYDFRYDYVYETYANLFGKKNVGVFFFEDYRDNRGYLIKENSQVKLFNALNKFLGLNLIHMQLGHYNEAMPSNKISVKAKLNNEYPHDLGNHLMESAEKHRIKKYLEEDLGFYENEEETYSDVLTKRRLITDTMASDIYENLNYEANSGITTFFKKFYEEGNIRLSSMLNIDLSIKYTDLKL